MSCSAFTSCILLCPRSEWYFMLFYGKHNMEETAETVLIEKNLVEQAYCNLTSKDLRRSEMQLTGSSWSISLMYLLTWTWLKPVNFGTTRIALQTNQKLATEWKGASFNLMQSKAHKFQGSCSLTSCVTKRLHQLWMLNSESKKTWKH